MFREIIFFMKRESKFTHFPHLSIEISSNQLFGDFFSKTIAFTKFLQKKCVSKLSTFPHALF